MPLVIADRVRETTNTVGTGSLTLAGPYTGFQPFSVIGNGSTTYYAIIDSATGSWEVGVGTYTTSGNTLSRDMVLASSNAGSVVNFSSGTKDVILTQPAERSVSIQSGGLGLQTGAPAFTSNGVLYANSSSTLTSGSALTFDGATFGLSPASGSAYLKASRATQSSGEVGIELFGGTGGGTSWYIFQPVSTNSLAFYGNGSEQMRLTSTGLGIGTSSPSYKLDVTGSGRFSQFVYVDGGQLILNNASANYLYFKNGTPLYVSDTVGNVRAALDASGNLGLGVTPSGWNSVLKFLEFPEGVGFGGYTGGPNLYAVTNAYYSNAASWVYKTTAAASNYEQGSGQHRWYTAPSGTAGSAITFTQAMTLDASGNLLVGRTDNPNFGRVAVKFDGAILEGMAYQTTNASTGSSFLTFRNSAGTLAGYISHNGTTTVAYNTSSDYRLKENVQPMQNALATVAKLNPVTYTWKADGSDGQGFIAHELQSVVPDCVTGEKDAVDAEGNPVYQGIDTSFLVATLTAAIQELKADFDAYKATHP